MLKKNKHIDKDQYKHYLIDTVEILTKENKNLRQQLDDLQKEYSHFKMFLQPPQQT
jgi:cell division septum initiation protein DivIVA